MRFAPLLVAAGLVAGCGGAGDTAQRMLARQQAIDPPELWRIERFATRGAGREVSYVCADTLMRQGFVRTQAEVDGEPCHATARQVEKPGLAALRCEAEGRTYVFSTATHGDLARDFQLTVAVTPLDRSLGPAARTSRFLKLGPCPAGWRIGDEGPPKA
jgi:hypothetical protein